MKPAPALLRALCRRDPALGRALDRHGPFPDLARLGRAAYRSHFQALAQAIVHQQLAGQAARTIWRRLCALTPGEPYPSAASLLALSGESLRAAGLSANKAAALRDLAERSLDGRLRLASISRQADDAAIEHLTQVRGIGVWSAQMFLLFRLGRLDVLPSTDLAVQEGLRICDGLEERPGPALVEARASAWRPLRSVGSWLMYRLTDSAREARP
jgi:DNA-3-methyladenine glycosylase II